MSMKSVSTPERFFTCSKTNFATFSLARPCRTVPRITGIKSGRVFMADILPPIRLPASSKQCAGASQAAVLILVVGLSSTQADLFVGLFFNPAVNGRGEDVSFRRHQVGGP